MPASDPIEDGPLLGLRVAVTRPAAQARELVERLRSAGAEPLEVPAIVIVDPDDGGRALRVAAADADRYDWVVLTSANGARRLVAELDEDRSLGEAQVAAIGPGTATALAAGGVSAEVVPDTYVAEELLAALPDPPAGGGRVLLARAAVARDVLPEGLRARGWQVDVVEAYRTETSPLADSERRSLARADIVTFTSSSTVTRHLEQVGGPDAVTALVACIGPVTGETARAAGLAVAVEAPVHTVEGLVDALVAWRTDGTGS